jgi:3-isopropylmalate/(R)-2-methylmalate dehydratase small subunit
VNPVQSLRRRGRCHVFGDDIPLDEGLIPFELAIKRVDDPELLKPHLFKQLDPTFLERVRPGDFVVAGRNFACGKPHLQGFIAMASLGLGLLCHSTPYKSLRGAISKGMPVMTSLPVEHGLETGDEIEVDFASGEVLHTQNARRLQLVAMAPDLQSIVRAGGTRGQLATWLSAHPEMAEPRATA